MIDALIIKRFRINDSFIEHDNSRPKRYKKIRKQLWKWQDYNQTYRIFT